MESILALKSRRCFKEPACQSFRDTLLEYCKKHWMTHRAISTLLSLCIGHFENTARFKGKQILHLYRKTIINQKGSNMEKCGRDFLSALGVSVSSGRIARSTAWFLRSARKQGQIQVKYVQAGIWRGVQGVNALMTLLSIVVSQIKMLKRFESIRVEKSLLVSHLQITNRVSLNTT